MTKALRDLALCIAVVIAHAAPASADNKAEAKPHVAIADREFKLGHFKEALAEYGKAYELFPAPALLFNIGQCERYLKDYERAIFSFQSYLREKPDAANRATVEDLIHESQAALDAERADAARKAAEAEARAKADEELRLETARRAEAEAREKAAAQAHEAEEARARAAVEERKRAELEAKRRDDDDRRRRDDHVYKKWWFWSIVGGAAVAAGGTAYYFSGSTTFVSPSGSLGRIDGR